MPVRAALFEYLNSYPHLFQTFHKSSYEIIFAYAFFEIGQIRVLTLVRLIRCAVRIRPDAVFQMDVIWTSMLGDYSFVLA